MVKSTAVGAASTASILIGKTIGAGDLEKKLDSETDQIEALILKRGLLVQTPF
ncbi:MAG: hypothetical protein ACI4E0_05470 [Blautia sp.]